MGSQFAHNDGTQIPVSAQHGHAEQWAGTVFDHQDFGGHLGVTPPTSPRRTNARTGPRSASVPRVGRHDDDERDRDREREQRRRPQRDNEDRPLPEGWGNRMLAAENRIRELAEAVKEVQAVVEGVNSRANTKIDEMAKFVSEVEGRFNGIESTIPERCHKLERSQEGFANTINGLTSHLQEKLRDIEDANKRLTTHLQEKFREIENAMRDRPNIPPVPPSFGGPNNYNIGSPLSAPPV